MPIYGLLFSNLCLIFVLIFVYKNSNIYLNKKYFWSGFLGFFASLTRVTGVIIFLAFAIELLWKYLKKKELPKRESLFLLLIPCGLIAYMVFLAWKFNEPLAFVKIQDM